MRSHSVSAPCNRSSVWSASRSDWIIRACVAPVPQVPLDLPDRLVHGEEVDVDAPGCGDTIEARLEHGGRVKDFWSDHQSILNAAVFDVNATRDTIWPDHRTSSH